MYLARDLRTRPRGDADSTTSGKRRRFGLGTPSVDIVFKYDGTAVGVIGVSNIFVFEFRTIQ